MDINNKIKNSKVFKTLDLRRIKSKPSNVGEQRRDHTYSPTNCDTSKWEHEMSLKRQNSPNLKQFQTRDLSFSSESQISQNNVKNNSHSSTTITDKTGFYSHKNMQTKDFGNYIDSTLSNPNTKSSIPSGAKANIDASELSQSVSGYGIRASASKNLSGVDLFSVDYYYCPTPKRIDTSIPTTKKLSHHKSSLFNSSQKSKKKTQNTPKAFNEKYIPQPHEISNNPYFTANQVDAPKKDYLRTSIIDKNLVSKLLYNKQ
ncbi:hypothetical protein BB558_007065 [Smittium angustum]|uniref:Uncharacterized protein n=1 Tax=Smittium angustum TaxID=133377 RepID=A0A2U1IW36_SMIAN|nr:hypothetical protein BB558_007065 [Smittium angustum]